MTIQCPQTVAMGKAAMRTRHTCKGTHLVRLGVSKPRAEFLPRMTVRMLAGCPDSVRLTPVLLAGKWQWGGVAQSPVQTTTHRLPCTCTHTGNTCTRQYVHMHRQVRPKRTHARTPAGHCSVNFG